MSCIPVFFILQCPYNPDPYRIVLFYLWQIISYNQDVYKRQILNKTLKAMPSDMLTSALAIYDSTADKVTFLDFVKDNMLAFFATAGFFVLTIISIILVLLRKARKARCV